jgi:hypothetical protein
MQRKNNTLKHFLVCALVFALFLSIFSGLGLLIMVVGIYWAFQLFFSVGWWAALGVVIVLLVVYVTALAFALELIKGENE